MRHSRQIRQLLDLSAYVTFALPGSIQPGTAAGKDLAFQEPIADGEAAQARDQVKP